MQNKESFKTIASNKKAYHDYFIIDKFEVGIELFGTEVKSLRQGNVNLKDSYCTIDNGELFVKGMHISPYEKGNIFNKDPMRVRKLLMHKRQILTLYGKMKQDGNTLVPLNIYFKGSLVKISMALCKGKNLHDKRDSSAKKDAIREIERGLRTKEKY